MDPLHLTFDGVRTDSDDSNGLEDELKTYVEKTKHYVQN